MIGKYGISVTVAMIFIHLHSMNGVLAGNRRGDMDQKLIKRQKKSLLLFPDSSCFGLTTSFVLPTDNNVRDVFMAVAFETSYNFASTIDGLLPPTLMGSRSYDAMKKLRKSITRRAVYRSFRGKFNSLGYDGHQCLSKAICEAAETPLWLYNGVLGDILHIILTPSMSKAEKLNREYYKAEAIGKKQNCSMYYKECPISVLDLISVFETK